MLTILAIAIFLASYWLIKRTKKSSLSAKVKQAGYTEVPMVKGCYPLVGHGIAFGKDIMGFMRKAYAEYGKVFRIKIFRKEMIVVCDRTLVRDFFKQPENEMSMYDVLDSLFFADAFADDPNDLLILIKIVRKTVSINYDTFVPKIVAEAEHMIRRMLKNAEKEKTVSLSDECMEFVSRTSARCFIDIDLCDEFYAALMGFTHILNKVIILTYFLPKWLLCASVKPILRIYRSRMNKLLAPEIEKYREDLTKTDSLIFRTAVDYRDETTGRALDNADIGNIIVGLLYVASENTALGLSATLIDLANDGQFWDRVRDESANILRRTTFDPYSPHRSSKQLSWNLPV